MSWEVRCVIFFSIPGLIFSVCGYLGAIEFSKRGVKIPESVFGVLLMSAICFAANLITIVAAMLERRFP